MNLKNFQFHVSSRKKQSKKRQSWKVKQNFHANKKNFQLERKIFVRTDQKKHRKERKILNLFNQFCTWVQKWCKIRWAQVGTKYTGLGGNWTSFIFSYDLSYLRYQIDWPRRRWISFTYRFYILSHWNFSNQNLSYKRWTSF